MSSPLISHSLKDVLGSLSNWLILTGAGCSTKAGLGDYRNRRGEWKRPQPITGQLFREDEHARKRYWARSAVGWPHFSTATPTSAHHAISQFQETGKAPCLITQNVDRLHQQAGHKNVIDLHGVLGEVVCLQCDNLSTRDDVQEKLIQQNPWIDSLNAAYAPDGDADLEHALIETVKIPNCELCGGMLKPNVVFFGENVPKARTDSAFEALKQAQGLLVIGSSLMVYSGFRFCRKAVEQNKPIVLVNQGVTRADDLANFKFEGECGEVMSSIFN